MNANAAVELSNALGQTVESLGPSVVRVEDGRGRPSTGISWDGSGLIVSASHPQEREDALEVGLHDGTTAKATLIGFDNSTDVALLKVDAKVPAPRWSDGADLKVGHLVLSLGRPGRTVRAAMGIASAIGSDWRTPSGGKIDRYLQADVGRFPGFSGGPLADAAGGVLGMYTSALVRGSHVSVPTPTLRRVVAALQAHGSVRRGFLGVGAYPVQLPDALAKKAGQQRGVLVISIQDGGPADAAGITLGDLLLSYEGQPLESPGDLVALLDHDTVGKRATVKLARSGAISDAVVTVGARG